MIIITMLIHIAIYLWEYKKSRTKSSALFPVLSLYNFDRHPIHISDLCKGRFRIAIALIIGADNYNISAGLMEDMEETPAADAGGVHIS